MNVLEKVKQFKWNKWIQRPFSPFVTSLFQVGATKEYYEKIGIPDIELKAQVYQHGYWYQSKEVIEDMAKELGVYLKTHTIFDITKSMEKFYEEKKKFIKSLVKQKGDLMEQFKILYDIFAKCTAYIWAAHGLEEYYNEILKKEVPKYIKEDVDKFIGDASFPKKKNKHVLMEEALRRGDDLKEVAEEYGWMRARDGFSEPFSVEDMKKIKEGIKPLSSHPKVDIPKHLQKLFDEAQELVYFRTARTDVFYEFLVLARPILKKVAKKYNIPFSELKNYTATSLINGNPEKYNDITFICYKGEAIYSDDLLIEDKEEIKQDFVKGTIAHKGIVKGIVKVVRFVSELDKVNKGDILVTQMTFPSFITAMNKAAAFVTDEGGITRHAAIVAREMKKPCIIGTKIATKVFKDGDKVIVDADKGEVRKLDKKPKGLNNSNILE